MLTVDVWSGQRDDPQRPGVTESVFRLSQVNLRSDNQAVIKAINHGHAVDEFLCMGMRYIHYQMALVDGRFSSIYVNTKENVWADGLSRGNSTVESQLISKGYSRIFVPEGRLQRLMDIDI